jgi:hypothetical protein
MEIPEDFKQIVKEGQCGVCCDRYVVCVTEDFPRVQNPPVDIEIDREAGAPLLRNIVKDDPDNPLVLEYFIDKKFVEEVTKSGEIEVIFVDSAFNEESRLRIKLEKEDMRLLRREVGLPYY